MNIEKLYYSRYIFYTRFFLKFMKQQKFELVNTKKRININDVVSKRRIWQQIWQKGIDDLKKVISLSNFLKCRYYFSKLTLVS